MGDLEALRAAIREIEERTQSESRLPDITRKARKPEKASGDSTAESPQECGISIDEVPEGKRAFDKIVRLLNQTEKSSAQVRERLKRDGYSTTAIEEAIEKAISYGIVDDRRYAHWLVQGRLRQGRGITGIERELATLSISLEDLDGWPEDFGYEEAGEHERALNYLEAHPTHAKNLRESAYRKLVTKGFSSSIAASAARTYYESRRDDTRDPLGL